MLGMNEFDNCSVNHVPVVLLVKAWPELVGIDTEAAEQIFHLANRWQSNLSNSHPVHFHLQLLLFCSEHNARNKGHEAWQKYLAKQAVSADKPQRKRPHSSAPTPDELPCDEPCVDEERPPPRKKHVVHSARDDACSAEC